ESVNRMRIATLSGSAYVEGMGVPAGYYVSVEIGEDGNFAPNTWRAAQPLSEAERARYALSESIPETLLNYQIEVQEPLIISNSGGGVSNQAPNFGAPPPPPPVF